MFTIFALSYCPYCKKAEDLLLQCKQPYQRVDLDLLPEIRKFLSEKLNHSTVPIVYRDGKFLGGAQELQYHLKETCICN